MSVNTSSLKIDLSREGLALCFKPYQVIVMKNLWNSKEGHKSQEAWVKANEELRKEALGKTISRASIINFLNLMVDEGVLDYRTTTGKGGHHRIYKDYKGEKKFWKYITDLANKKLGDAAFASKGSRFF